MTGIATTPELCGALISDLSDDPNAVLKGQSLGADVVTVSNSADEVNLILPYYSSLSKNAGAKISDEDLASASGGGYSFMVNFNKLLYDAMASVRSFQDSFSRFTVDVAVERNSDSSIFTVETRVRESD